MNSLEAREFQLVYRAGVTGKRAFIRIGIVVYKFQFGSSIPDVIVLPLDTWDDDFWKYSTSKNFQGIDRWYPTKEEAIDGAQSNLKDELSKKAEQEQEGINALNDLRNLVRWNE